MKDPSPEQEIWDERYKAGWVFGQEPNEYLRSLAHLLHLGMKALAVADGQGRNGIWMAQRGLDVTSIDVSPLALSHARQLADERGADLETICADLADWSAPAGEYDVVVEIFAHFPAAVRGKVHSNLVRALKPGGLLIFEGFEERQAGRPSGGPKDASMLHSREKLLREFAGLEFLELLEGTAVLREGVRHQGEAWVVRAVARKA